jgi:hypothetical protein
LVLVEEVVEVVLTVDDVDELLDEVVVDATELEVVVVQVSPGLFYSQSSCR